MGDAADAYTDNGLDELAMHRAGRCGESVGPCPYCFYGKTPRGKPMTTQQLTVQPHQGAGQLQQAFGAFSPGVLVEQVQLIQQAMRDVMHDGEHFGVIPGTERKDATGRDVSKRCLYKPGAEKLGFLFRLAPDYKIDLIDLPNHHREYRVVCRLESIQNGAFVGSGVGSCSTMETKYRWRNSARKCPHCGQEAIIKGKEEYGGGWVCFKKKDGCGAKFQDGDPAIEGQAAGRVENTDLADCYNTCLKMAKKRAHVDAILTATAASDIFTQDLDDAVDDDAPKAAPKTAPKTAATPKPAAKPAAAPSPGAAFRALTEQIEAGLVEAGQCRDGELLRHVREAGVAAGGAPEMGGWDDHVVAAAKKAGKAFVTRVQAEPAGDAAEAATPDTTPTTDPRDDLLRAWWAKSLGDNDHHFEKRLLAVGVALPDTFTEPLTVAELLTRVKPLLDVGQCERILATFEAPKAKARGRKAS